MTPDDSAPRIPERRREVRSYTPGATSRSSDPFRGRRVSSGEPEKRSRRRRTDPVFTVRREVVIGVVLVAAVAVMAGGVWLGGRIFGRSGDVAKPVAAKIERPEVAPMVWQGPIPSEVAEKFTSATTHDQRLRWVRQADEVGSEMDKFFRDGAGAAEKVTATVPLTTGESGGMIYEIYKVEMERGQPRLLWVSVDPEGAKVDFEAYSRHGSEGWDDLLSGAAKSADEVRVILQPGGFFLHRFPDENKWAHYKASTPDLADSLDFYVARDSDAARELAKLGDSPAHATVSIRAVEDSVKFRQFEITAVKATSWVEPEE